jgi:hypothetical protein
MLSTDRVDFKIDQITGDIVIGTDVQFVAGMDAVVQGARIRIMMVMGEWFLNLDAGVPWFERMGVSIDRVIFGQKYNEAKALSAIRTALLGGPLFAGVPAIVAVTKLTAVFNGVTRGVTISWQAKTGFGDTVSDTLAVGA